MRTYRNVVQGAIILPLRMMSALRYGAFNTLIYAVHHTYLPYWIHAYYEREFENYASFIFLF